MKFIITICITLIIISCSNTIYYKRSDGNIVTNPVYYGMIITNKKNANEWDTLRKKYTELQKKFLKTYIENNIRITMVPTKTMVVSLNAMKANIELFSENYFTRIFLSTDVKKERIYLDIIRPKIITDKLYLRDINRTEFHINISKIEIRFVNELYKIYFTKVNENLFISDEYKGIKLDDIDIYLFSENQEIFVMRDYWNDWTLSVGEKVDY